MRSGETRLLAALLATSVIFASTDVLAQSQREDRIVLPLELVAGKPATLGVLAPNGHTEPNVQVLLSDGETVTTDESGRAHFLAPASPGILFARIQGTKVCAAAEVQTLDSSAELNVDAMTRLAPIDGQIEVRGSGFDGDADKNEVILGAGRALVLAASPLELFVLPPPDSQPGTTEVNLTTRAQHASTRVTLLRVAATPLSVPPRKKGKISIRVFGTAEPVSLQVHNIHPEVVQISGKQYVAVQSSGGSENSAEIQVKGLRAGEFSFSVHLIREIETAGLPAARAFLEAAEKIAPTAERSVFENILDKLKKKHPDAPAVRALLQRLAPEGPAGDYGALIRAASESLFGAE